MRKIDVSYDDGILNKDDEYIVGVNDGTTFNNVYVFNGSVINV